MKLKFFVFNLFCLFLAKSVLLASNGKNSSNAIVQDNGSLNISSNKKNKNKDQDKSSKKSKKNKSQENSDDPFAGMSTDLFSDSNKSKASKSSHKSIGKNESKIIKENSKKKNIDQIESEDPFAGTSTDLFDTKFKPKSEQKQKNTDKSKKNKEEAEKKKKEKDSWGSKISNLFSKAADKFAKSSVGKAVKSAAENVATSLVQKGMETAVKKVEGIASSQNESPVSTAQTVVEPVEHEVSLSQQDIEVDSNGSTKYEDKTEVILEDEPVVEPVQEDTSRIADKANSEVSKIVPTQALVPISIQASSGHGGAKKQKKGAKKQIKTKKRAKK